MKHWKWSGFIAATLYISKISLPIQLQGNMWTNPVNIYITHMNVEIGTEAEQFPEKEYINWSFLAVHTAEAVKRLCHSL